MRHHGCLCAVTCGSDPGFHSRAGIPGRCDPVAGVGSYHNQAAARTDPGKKQAPGPGTLGKWKTEKMVLRAACGIILGIRCSMCGSENTSLNALWDTETVLTGDFLLETEYNGYQ